MILNGTVSLLYILYFYLLGFYNFFIFHCSKLFLLLYWLKALAAPRPIIGSAGSRPGEIVKLLGTKPPSTSQVFHFTELRCRTHFRLK